MLHTSPVVTYGKPAFFSSSLFMHK